MKNLIFEFVRIEENSSQKMKTKEKAENWNTDKQFGKFQQTTVLVNWP